MAHGTSCAHSGDPSGLTDRFASAMATRDGHDDAPRFREAFDCGLPSRYDWLHCTAPPAIAKDVAVNDLWDDAERVAWH